MNREVAEAWALGGAGAAKGVMEVIIRPELKAHRGWLAVAGLVTAYELACPPGQTLSEGVDRGIEKHPWLVPAVIGGVALHLMNAYEKVGMEKLDPIHRFSEFLKK